MRIAAASLNQTPLDWENNKRNILEAITLAKEQQINLLCLPEMCITGYGCEDMFLHPWVAKTAMDILLKLVPHTKNLGVIIGLPYHLNNKIYNVVCLLNNQQILGFQAKQHLPRDGVHYEPRWFSPWKSKEQTTIEIQGINYPFGDKTYRINNQSVGFEICEDAWVEDRPACYLAEENINIILNPSASHFAMTKSILREKKVVDASKTFNCTYVFANQLGNEAGRIIYDGDAIIAHRGEVVANTSLFSYNNINFTACEIDYGTHKVAHKEVVDNKMDAKSQFTAATTLGLFDYLRKSHSKGFVLSLSGGADSSTCLVLLVEMVKRGVMELGLQPFVNKILGEHNAYSPNTEDEIINHLITTAYQSTDNSSTATFEAAATLAKSVHAKFYHWSIQEETDQARSIIEDAINRPLSWDKDDVVLQNIQARSRSPIIWMLANLKNSLLITTSNRSEGSVGYATMDGDTSGSLAPIAGVSKTFILDWLKWAEKELNYPGLEKVNRLIPTAELRPAKRSQSDENDLMPYSILNKIEKLFILEKLSPKAIYIELSKQLSPPVAAKHIIKFFQLWGRNQWKRERLAPSFELDAYNIDPRSWYRFPILSSGFNNELDELRKLVR